MSVIRKSSAPVRCSACRGDYEDPDASANEGDDTAAEAEGTTGE